MIAAARLPLRSAPAKSQFLRPTLSQWVGVTGVQLQPLVDALRDVVLGQQVIHVDETPVQMLMPGTKKTHRSYVWAYATCQFSDVAAVVYDFSPSRAGEHARNFLQDWKGKLVCDDFGGYKASFELGVTEIGCMAHARRKFFELHATYKSTLAEHAMRYIQLLYEIESEVRDLEPDLRREIRQEKAVPVMEMLHAWMSAQRDLVPEGSAISKALDYSLKRWAALSRYLDDGAVPIDNNWCENQIRPWALERGIARPARPGSETRQSPCMHSRWMLIQKTIAAFKYSGMLGNRQVSRFERATASAIDMRTPSDICRFTVRSRSLLSGLDARDLELVPVVPA